MNNAVINEQVSQQVFEMLGLVYIKADERLRIIECSTGSQAFGFQGLDSGRPLDEVLDFMVGIDASTQISLPLVMSPSGVHLSVTIIPEDKTLTVLMVNASQQAEQRRLLQQHANENELLLRQQKILSRDLSNASKELEEKNIQLEEATRLQSGFLSGVSHEFRTPLTSIIGYTHLLEEKLKGNLRGDADEEPESQPQSYLRALKRSSKHLLSLVENLLDHGKYDSNEIVIHPRAVKLNEVFEDVIALLSPLATTKSIELNSALDFDEHSTALIDDMRLRQCLINLVGNAVKFTDQGQVCVSAKLEDMYLKFSVCDTGQGIPAEDLEKIRLPFYQGANTGKIGTGLGLTITERILELMGGELDISSQPGQGTLVSGQIPISIVDELPFDKMHQEAQSKISGMSVLLAEDDADIAVLLSLMLEEKGLDVTHVENGALALAAMSQQQFDLLLLDVHMPVQDGYETLKALRDKEDKTPVVVMSASKLDEDRSKATLLGASAYLVKPLDADDVIQLICEFDAT